MCKRPMYAVAFFLRRVSGRFPSPRVGCRYEHYGRALGSKGLRVVPVEGDGNCLFRSVSHQVYGDDSHHRLVRARCMDYMEVRGGQASRQARQRSSAGAGLSVRRCCSAAVSADLLEECCESVSLRLQGGGEELRLCVSGETNTPAPSETQPSSRELVEQARRLLPMVIPCKRPRAAVVLALSNARNFFYFS